MISILYDSCLIFALPDGSGKYKVLVAASLATSSIEEADNGKGMQMMRTVGTAIDTFQASSAIHLPTPGKLSSKAVARTSR